MPGTCAPRTDGYYSLRMKPEPNNAAADPADTAALQGNPLCNCTIICGDSRKELAAFEGQVDLIVTSPPYADARHKHYDSIHPDEFADWFLSFHESFFKALKP